MKTFQKALRRFAGEKGRGGEREITITGGVRFVNFDAFIAPQSALWRLFRFLAGGNHFSPCAGVPGAAGEI